MPRRVYLFQFYQDTKTARRGASGISAVSNLDLRLRAHLYRKRIPRVHGLRAIREPAGLASCQKRIEQDSRAETKSHGGSHREFKRNA
ncbi:unnamed protein product [Lasius platythorax]|uniref:Uncharacterized protein n=1 Tax=Lasius platythorax TaxID=488582 RepID=A0AAV2NKH4_9HYME